MSAALVDHAGQALRRFAQIERNGFNVAACRQRGHHLAAEIAGAAGDENFHAGSLRLQNVDTVSPETMCQMPHQAVTMAMPPRPSKKLNIRIRPSAEFWMPTSIDTARRSRSGRPLNFAAK
jgi:hypothetical protein